MARRPFFALRRRGQIRIQQFLQFRTRIPYRSCSGTCQGNGGICPDCSDLRVACTLHGSHRGQAADQRTTLGPLGIFYDLVDVDLSQVNVVAQTPADPTDKMSMLRLWPKKFVAVFGCFFRRYAVTCDVFRYDARDEEVQQIIFTTCLSAAAAHLESAKRMTANNRAGARAVDVNIAGFQLRFDALYVGWAAREKAAG